VKKITIGIQNILIDCTIGAIEKEREQKQQIEMDLILTYDADKAIAFDDVSYAVDYRDIIKILKKEAEKEFFLLETFAYHILQSLFSFFPLFYAKITIYKKAYGFSAEKSFVTMEKK
jgi:7,8-dihydroneopterin aldolase/epimerase/oxygenase